MFFELSNGTYLNMDHVTSIPIKMDDVRIPVSMIDGSTRSLVIDDVVKIRALLRSHLLNPSYIPDR